MAPSVLRAPAAVLVRTLAGGPCLLLDGWRWFMDAAGPGPLQDALHGQARAALAPELQRLGLDPRAQEPAADTWLRGTQLRGLALWADEALLAEARRRVRADLDGWAQRPPDLRQTWMGAVGVAADERLFQDLLDAALVAITQSERLLLPDALAANRDPALTARTLALSLQGRLQPLEAFWLPGRRARGSAHAALAHAHAVAHFDALVQRVDGAGCGEREGLLPGIAGQLHRAQYARQLLHDQARLVGEGGAVNARRAVQQMALRDSWRQREGAQVLGRWLSAQR